MKALREAVKESTAACLTEGLYYTADRLTKALAATESKEPFIALLAKSAQKKWASENPYATENKENGK